MLVDHFVAHESGVLQVIGQSMRALRQFRWAHSQWCVVDCDHDIERMGWKMIGTDMRRVDMPALRRAARVGIHHAAKGMFGITA